MLVSRNQNRTGELLGKRDNLNQSFRSNRGKQDGEIKKIAEILSAVDVLTAFDGSPKQARKSA